MKNLYLVKMGMDYTAESAPDMMGSDVGNYRIRGTFHDKNGDVIFVEFGNGYQRDNKGKSINAIKLRVDSQFNTSIDWDCNNSNIGINYDMLDKYNYTKRDILKYIKDVFGVEFDNLELIDTRFFNYDYHEVPGDEIIVDTNKVGQAKKIYDYFYKYEKEVEKKKYPNFSMYYEDNVLTVLLHYNCYNDIVKIEDEFKFDFNYIKPVEEIEKAQRKWYASHGRR